ncbi:MAG: hypothetical protein IPK72_08485 [Candidatus Eisenbacteria bacterium]|nr:hypothetical protein [Candidatus Eisenbacteria bacterium]
MTVAEYGSEYSPGILHGPGMWDDPDDPRFRVFSIDSSSGPGNADYDEWPILDGAPVDPEGRPLQVGARTTWSCFHDGVPERHTNFAGNTAPLELQIRQLSHAYGGMTGPLSRAILVRWDVENRSPHTVEEAFIGVWMDGDLGDSSDDLAGSNPTLGMSFVRNAGPDEIYGEVPPVVAVAVLRGPSGGQDAYAAVDYEILRGPATALESYNLLRGLSRFGDAQIDSATGLPTRFWHSGDPVAGEGWIDETGGDKRTLLSVGPFDLSTGAHESLDAVLIIETGPEGDEAQQRLKAAVGLVRALSAKEVFPLPREWAVQAVPSVSSCPESDSAVFIYGSSRFPV